jgi:bifunctional DNA-binding transcriptional regulator/antitoxin component of YhaV-PrlF toxin-antitoxin module
MPKTIPELPRATIWMDIRGRVTIPEYLRNALGLHEGGWIELEAYPSLDECKTLILKKT